MLIFVDGILAHSTEHCKRVGVSYSTVCMYVYLNRDINMTHEQAIEICIAKKLVRDSSSWAKIARANNMKLSTLKNRIRRWGSLQKALEAPVRVWRKKCQNV